jgi:hypothetical protein
MRLGSRDSGLHVLRLPNARDNPQRQSIMSNPIRKHIPTSVQIQKEQTERADREREARLAAGRKVVAQQRGEVGVTPQGNGGAVVPVGKADVALPDARTPQQAYLDEIAPSGIVGRLLKFGKSGTFVAADTDEAVDPEQAFTALCDQVAIGFQKFQEGAPPTRHMGLLYGDPPFIMPKREGLGDNDPSAWPLGLDGQPQDVWAHTIFLPLQKGDGSAELFTFSTSSRTGRRAVGNLLRHYDRLRRTHPDDYPIVKLKAGGFAHRDERIGWVATPTFAVCGRAPRDSVAQPDASPGADMSDEIPF